LKPASRSAVGTSAIKAQWVEPSLRCDVEYSHVDSAGLIVDAVFKKFDR
jgi:hypothetical protein